MSFRQPSFDLFRQIPRFCSQVSPFARSLSLLIGRFLRVSDHGARVLVAAKQAQLRFGQTGVGTLDISAVPDAHELNVLIDSDHSLIFAMLWRKSLKITAEYVEAKTGRGSDAVERRPQLAAALASAKAAKCSVVVAKLDRLSRDVAFVAGL